MDVHDDVTFCLALNPFEATVKLGPHAFIVLLMSPLPSLLLVIWG